MMRPQYVVGALTAGVLATSVSAAVTEVSIFRQLAARARNGSFSAPTVDARNNTNEVLGVFADSQAASLPAPGAASATSTQNTTVNNGEYFGMIRAEASASGNPSGTCDASCSYGPAGSSFQTTFSIGFTVDVPTLARFTGDALATRTNSTGSIICQAILGDVLGGVPQPATIFAQPTANAPQVFWDQTILLLPGHSYSFTATVNASQSNTFSSTAGMSTSTINFNVLIPSPATASMLGMMGLVAARRRRS